MAHCSEWFNRKAYFSLFSNVGGTVCFITEDVAVKYDFLNKKCVCVCGGGGGGVCVCVYNMCVCVCDEKYEFF